MLLFGKLGSLKIMTKPNGPVWRKEVACIDNIVHQNLGLESAKYFDSLTKGNLQFFNKRVHIVRGVNDK